MSRGTKVGVSFPARKPTFSTRSKRTVFPEGDQSSGRYVTFAVDFTSRRRPLPSGRITQRSSRHAYRIEAPSGDQTGSVASCPSGVSQLAPAPSTAATQTAHAQLFVG